MESLFVDDALPSSTARIYLSIDKGLLLPDTSLKGKTFNQSRPVPGEKTIKSPLRNSPLGSLCTAPPSVPSAERSSAQDASDFFTAPKIWQFIAQGIAPYYSTNR